MIDYVRDVDLDIFTAALQRFATGADRENPTDSIQAGRK
jgi:hypothetical protein